VAVIDAQLAAGPARRRVGLLGLEKAPVREGAPLLDESGRVIGRVSSGTSSPTLKQPIAMGCVEAALAAPDTALWAEVRGRRLPMRVARLPFVPHRYVRG
jgi:aminomethyltransferase